MKHETKSIFLSAFDPTLACSYRVTSKNLTHKAPSPQVYDVTLYGSPNSASTV